MAAKEVRQTFLEVLGEAGDEISGGVNFSQVERQHWEGAGERRTICFKAGAVEAAFKVGRGCRVEIGLKLGDKAGLSEARRPRKKGKAAAAGFKPGNEGRLVNEGGGVGD